MTTRHELLPIAKSLHRRLVVERILCNTNPDTEALIRCTPRLLEMVEEARVLLGWSIDNYAPHKSSETQRIQDLLARIDGDLD
jgi:hypothetical protein